MATFLTKSPEPDEAQESSPRQQHRSVVLAGLVLGLGLILVLLAAAVIDVLSFDQTSGGTPPTYQDYTGTPIDWDSFERTETGFLSRGYLLDASLDCTTGMISFEVLGIKRDYRQVSERALQLHQPREACIRHGFEPRF